MSKLRRIGTLPGQARMVAYHVIESIVLRRISSSTRIHPPYCYLQRYSGLMKINHPWSHSSLLTVRCRCRLTSYRRQDESSHCHSRFRSKRHSLYPAWQQPGRWPGIERMLAEGLANVPGPNASILGCLVQMPIGSFRVAPCAKMRFHQIMRMLIVRVHSKLSNPQGSFNSS
jgi:hypothetical protein